MEIRTESTGFTEFIENPKDKIPDFDPRSGNHYWIMITTYKCDPEKMLKGDGPAFFDHESLVAVLGPGCFYCEQIYTPLLSKRRCKGEL
jgi:hypothetical protein